MVFIIYEIKTASDNPVAPQPISTKISEATIIDTAQITFNIKFDHILFLLYIDISMRFETEENIVDSARYISGCLSVKSLPYKFISDSPNKRINKTINVDITVIRAKLTNNTFLNFLLSFKIHDSIGSVIWLIAVGINSIIILHWSAASKEASVAYPSCLTNIVLISQNAGVTVSADNVAGML